MSDALKLPAWLKASGDTVLLAIKLHPRGSRDEVAGEAGGELKVKVTAPPVDGAANEALLRFLASHLGCPRGAVRLVRGQTARHKSVAVTGMSAGSVVKRLA